METFASGMDTFRFEIGTFHRGIDGLQPGMATSQAEVATSQAEMDAVRAGVEPLGRRMEPFTVGEKALQPRMNAVRTRVDGLIDGTASLPRGIISRRRETGSATQAASRNPGVIKATLKRGYLLVKSAGFNGQKRRAARHDVTPRIRRNRRQRFVDRAHLLHPHRACLLFSQISNDVDTELLGLGQ